jgi:hypothetical protein
MKVLAQTWFSSGRGLVGVVKAQNDEGEVGYYISPADGFNEVIDANNVAAWGARFPWVAGEALFKEVA